MSLGWLRRQHAVDNKRGLYVKPAIYIPAQEARSESQHVLANETMLCGLSRCRPLTFLRHAMVAKCKLLAIGGSDTEKDEAKRRRLRSVVGSAWTAFSKTREGCSRADIPCSLTSSRPVSCFASSHSADERILTEMTVESHERRGAGCRSPCLLVLIISCAHAVLCGWAVVSHLLIG
eukprot:scaffold376884_cov34-Prasinocladus_malaysianus.AAC.1